ncbi:hypothetical protein L484_007639 [Morus notabilis]|uniref:Uncharacterized protein n=1 Tax=Morus notabilis TaxID=981085 RepID=W9QB78_9ROSA|nr:hypothetical protein L484_007639 [Morus notabilis]
MKDFKVPENSNLDDIKTAFETRILYESKKEEGNYRTAPMSFSEDSMGRSESEPSCLSAMDMLSKNKEIILTAILAFSLGIFVSQKIQGREKKAFSSV